MPEQRDRAHQNPVTIGVKPIPRGHRCGGESKWDIALTTALLVGLDGADPQGMHPQINLFNDLDVADSADDNNTGPTIVCRQLCQTIPQQRSMQMSLAIDQQHAPFAGLRHRLSHPRVVSIAENRRHPAEKMGTLTKLAQLKRQVTGVREIV